MAIRQKMLDDLLTNLMSLCNSSCSRNVFQLKGFEFTAVFNHVFSAILTSQISYNNWVVSSKEEEEF